MAIPAGVSTAVVTVGVPVTFTGTQLRSYVTITPSAFLVHTETGTPLVNMLEDLDTAIGVSGQFTLPHTDQDGFQDEAGNAYKNWYYTLTIQYQSARATLPAKTKVFQLPVGQTVVDLDRLPGGAPALPYTAPTDVVTSVNGQTGAVDIPVFTDSAVRTAILANQFDKGEAFVNKLTMKTGDIAVGLAGDSTMNAMDEAADLYMVKLAADHPSLAVGIKHWNDTTQAYDAEVQVSTGIAETGGTVFHDTFSRTSADLYNSTPDIGEVWGRDGSNASGDWAVDGNKAVRTSDTVVGASIADGAVGGDMRVSFSGALTTVNNSGATRRFFIYLNYVDPANHVYASINIVDTTGVVSVQISKRIANVVTTLYSSASGALTANTSKVPYTLAFWRAGTALTFTLNGTNHTASITADDAIAINAGTKAGFTASAVTAGDWIDDFKMEIITAAPAKKLTFYNGSFSGSKLDYQEPRVAALFPVPLDVLLINSGHNYGAQTPAQYQTALDSFITAFRAVQPTSGIVITSQNPQKAPASNQVGHLLRQASVRSYAAKRGLGYVPGMEAFKNLPDGGVTLIATDGVHPTGGTTGTGSSLWRDAIANYFDTLVLDKSFKGIILLSDNGTRFRLSVDNDGALTTTSL